MERAGDGDDGGRGHGVSGDVLGQYRSISNDETKSLQMLRCKQTLLGILILYVSKRVFR